MLLVWQRGFSTTRYLIFNAVILLAILHIVLSHNQVVTVKRNNRKPINNTLEHRKNNGQYIVVNNKPSTVNKYSAVSTKRVKTRRGSEASTQFKKATDISRRTRFRRTIANTDLNAQKHSSGILSSAPNVPPVTEHRSSSIADHSSSGSAFEGSGEVYSQFPDAIVPVKQNDASGLDSLSNKVANTVSYLPHLLTTISSGQKNSVSVTNKSNDNVSYDGSLNSTTLDKSSLITPGTPEVKLITSEKVFSTSTEVTEAKIVPTSAREKSTKSLDQSEFNASPYSFTESLTIGLSPFNADRINGETGSTDSMDYDKHETSSATVPLELAESLGAVFNIRVHNRSYNFVSLTWTPSKIDSKFEIYDNNSIIIGSTQEHWYNVTSLKPNTKYTFGVRANNETKWIDVFTEKEPVDIEMYAAKNLRVKSVTNSSLEWEWDVKVPINESLNYIIEIRSSNSRVFDIIRRTNFKNDSLEPFTKYEFCVTPEIGNVQGPKRCLTNKTAEGVPSEVANLSLVYARSTEMRWSWDPPKHPNGELEYEIKIQTATYVVINTITTVNDFIVFELKPFLQHEICVCARNKKFQSRYVCKNETTAPAAPGKLYVWASCYIGSSTIIQWIRPTRLNGILEQYRLYYEMNNVRHGPIQFKSSDDSYKLNLTLFRNTTYKFSISAKNKNVPHWGESSEYTCTTKSGVPPKPNCPLVTQDVDNGERLTIEFSQTQESDDSGPIDSYQVIVFEKGQEEAPTEMCHNSSLTLNRNERTKEVVGPYMASPIIWNPFSRTNDKRDGMNCSPKNQFRSVVCTIGCDENCLRLNVYPCNKPLKPGIPYGVKLRVFTKVCYKDSDIIYVETYKSPVANIVGTIFAVLLCLIIALVLFIYFRRNRNKLRKFFKFPRSFSTPNLDFALENRKNRICTSKPIKLTDLESHFRVMNSDSALRFSQEFEDINAQSPTYVITAALLQDNRAKNRWINILPFDHSRVKLLPLADDISSDYINATYIPGYNSPREYIATQGPLPTTKDDFWRMIWEQMCPMIVMVTQCTERGKIKCEVYWPEDSEVHFYGDLGVSLRSVSILANYTIRIFDLRLGSRTFEVKQMHFTMWPDFGCPQNASVLLDFVESIRSHLPHELTGPTVVHCSAGVGRTGTFIAIDRLVQHIREHDFVDIFGTVTQMRLHRTNMVQTEDQYIYIHECLLQMHKNMSAKDVKRSSKSEESDAFSLHDVQL